MSDQDILVGEIEQPLRSALRFAASYSCITSAQEKAILSALRTHDDWKAAARIEELEAALRDIQQCTSEHGGAARALKIIRQVLGKQGAQ